MQLFELNCPTVPWLRYVFQIIYKQKNKQSDKIIEALVIKNTSSVSKLIIKQKIFSNKFPCKLTSKNQEPLYDYVKKRGSQASQPSSYLQAEQQNQRTAFSERTPYRNSTMPVINKLVIPPPTLTVWTNCSKSFQTQQIFNWTS